jgi:hypothetical protein
LGGAAELPLCYIDKIKSTGSMGFISWLCVSINTFPSIGQPCYAEDYYTNIKKIDNPLNLPKLANVNINLKFLEKATRNEFYE